MQSIFCHLIPVIAPEYLRSIFTTKQIFTWYFIEKKENALSSLAPSICGYFFTTICKIWYELISSKRIVVFRGRAKTTSFGMLIIILLRNRWRDTFLLKNFPSRSLAAKCFPLLSFWLFAAKMLKSKPLWASGATRNHQLIFHLNNE